MNEHSDNPAADLEVPEQLQYSTEHAWVDDSIDPAMIGITEYAADQMGELVFIDLPEPGQRVEAGDEIVELESSKAVQPLVSPVAGTIRYVNSDASEDPTVVTADPYGEGWIVKIALDDDQPELLDAEQYRDMIRKSA